MSLGNPTNIIIIALLGLAALLFLIASFTGGGKWRRLYQEESEDYAAYADRADQDLRDARQRIAELERELSALQQRHAEAEATIAGTVAAPAIATPVGTAITAAPEPELQPTQEQPLEPQPQPIVGERATITELPPAPIHVVTPLRAVEPEIVSPASDAVEQAREPAPPASEPVHAEPEPHAEAAHDGAAEHHEHKASPLTTLAHLAEGAALAEAAHLAWNAYSSHQHHAEPEHAASPAETVVHSPEQVVEAPAAPAAEAPAKTWFGASKRDDLSRMRGVDAAMNTRLFGLGVTSFDDIVHLSQEDEMALEQRLDLPAGYITREQWRDQAGLLRFGKDAEFNERFGTADA